LITEILMVAGLILMVMGFHALALPLGSSIVLVLSLPLHIPLIGTIYQLIIQGLFKMTLLIKLTSWFIAGSGAALGYLFYTKAIGRPPSTRVEWYAVLVAASACFCNSAHRVLLFTANQPTRDLQNIMHIRRLGEMVRAHKMRESFASSVVRATFLDMYVSRLIGMLTAAGLAFYALGSLRLVDTVGGSPPSLWQTLLLAWSLASIGGSFELFSGDVWQVIRILYQLVVFLWVIVYLQLASSLVRDEDLHRVVVEEISQVRAEEPLSVSPAEPTHETTIGSAVGPIIHKVIKIALRNFAKK
jgi:hypothetical protein